MDEAPPVLKRSFHLADYLAATKGLNVVKAVYLEVDVIPEQHNDEAKFVTEISKDPVTQPSPASFPADPRMTASLTTSLPTAIIHTSRACAA